jgi:phosphotransferase system HPr (HPr) family protein
VKKVVEQITVADPLGIHARPASALAIAVGKSGARVTLRYGQKIADARSVIQMLGLGALPNSVVTVEIEGEPAAVDEAIRAVQACLAGSPP